MTLWLAAGGANCEHLFISILQLFMFRTLKNMFIDRTRHMSKTRDMNGMQIHVGALTRT